MPGRPALRALLAATLALTWAAGCSSSDGRALPPPEPRQTTTPVSSPIVGLPTEDGGDGASEVFALFSDEFVKGDAIPASFSCDGENVSPPLDWASTPAATVELAIVVRDLDAAGYIHWVMTGIDPLITSIGEDGVPETAVEATNSAGTVGWTGPCPPRGSRHTYSFALHALAEPLALPPRATAEEAALAVEEASTAQAVLTGTFERK